MFLERGRSLKERERERMVDNYGQRTMSEPVEKATETTRETEAGRGMHLKSSGHPFSLSSSHRLYLSARGTTAEGWRRRVLVLFPRHTKSAARPSPRVRGTWKNAAVSPSGSLLSIISPFFSAAWRATVANVRHFVRQLRPVFRVSETSSLTRLVRVALTSATFLTNARTLKRVEIRSIFFYNFTLHWICCHNAILRWLYSITNEHCR